MIPLIQHPPLKDFKTNLCKFVRPKGIPFMQYATNLELNYLRNSLLVSLSDIRAHRFNHNFSCARSYVLLCPISLSCSRFNRLRISYFIKISEIIGSDVSMLPNDHLANILIYGSNVFNSVSNESIISLCHYVRNNGFWGHFRVTCSRRVSLM